MTSRSLAALAAGALVLAVAGCGGNRQSTLAPASHASRDIATLWWAMLGVAGVVAAVVLALLLVAVVRRHGERRGGGDRRATMLVLLGGMVAPILVLAGLFAAVLRILPVTSAPAAGRSPLTIDVVGKQWFWVARYEGTSAVVANELHIPVGVRVRVRVSTADVIHSFWVPELNRKIDMLPGKTNSILLRGDRVGVFRGQCAEFCGLQHAHMSFLVSVDSRAGFRSWLAAQARPRDPPATPLERRGEHVFLTRACAGCHTIRGTPARGRLGPDLTHLASRSTLAALRLPNAPGHLAGWILDPQHAKPGAKMPGLDLSGPQVEALLAYLEHLR